MATKEKTRTFIDDAQKYVDYCDIANGGLQAIFDGLLGIANNVRNYNENVSSKMSAFDLRIYLRGLLSQLDGLTDQASTVMDGLFRHHDGDAYNFTRRLLEDQHAKEKQKAVTEQRIKEAVAVAKKYGYLHELHAAVKAADQVKKVSNQEKRK